MEDADIQFDVDNIQHTIRGSEKILDVLNLIEDTKGNAGDRGRMLCTNLRIVWYSLGNPKFNLSVGLGCILTMTVQTVVRKIRSTTEALHIMCVAANTRYEFIFTNLGTSHKNFSTVFEILRKYQSATLYREMKLRSAIVAAGNLNLLAQEQIFNTIAGVWNLSSDQGNLGTFITTNVRLVWYADINETFNMSLPYLQIATIDLRSSKYGPALVITCKDTGGGYVLGFRIDPVDRLTVMHQELQSLFAVYKENPVYGVELEKRSAETAGDGDFKIDQIEELDETQMKELNHNFTVYQLDKDKSGVNKPIPVFSSELGFAIEPPRDGLKLKDLFQVIV